MKIIQRHMSLIKKEFKFWNNVLDCYKANTCCVS